MSSPILAAMLTIRRAEQLSDAGDQFSSVSFVREVHALTEARKAATGRIDNVITGLVDHRTGLALAAQGRGVGAQTWVGKAR